MPVFSFARVSHEWTGERPNPLEASEHHDFGLSIGFFVALLVLWTPESLQQSALIPTDFHRNNSNYATIGANLDVNLLICRYAHVFASR